MKFPSLPITAVYVIYSADVLAGSETFIDRMSPGKHMPAGYTGDAQAENARVAALFTETEGNDQYEYGYLGSESTPPDVRYFPAGYTDKDGTAEAGECPACEGYGYGPDGPRYPCETCKGSGSEPCGQGYHRKWVAELTREEWETFASAYVIDLDDDGYPLDYEETLGAITEHGHLEAVSVDNTEGWSDPHSGDRAWVIDSDMYVSFAYAEDPDGETDDIADAAQLSRIESSACDR